jgi:hypothetical protein
VTSDFVLFFLQGDSKILLCAQCKEAIIPLHQIRRKLFFIVRQWLLKNIPSKEAEDNNFAKNEL